MKNSLFRFSIFPLILLLCLIFSCQQQGEKVEVEKKGEEDLELDNASADTGGMEALAAIAHGRSIAPEQLPELLDELAAQTEHLEEKTETKRTYWDTWPFFLLLVGVLSVEWFLRKRWGLV